MNGASYVAVALAMTAGCMPSGAGSCPTTTTALTNGEGVPALPLSPAEQATIGALETPDGKLVCTGTFIGDRWIVTARHCANPASFDGLVFHTYSNTTELAALGAEYFGHPVLDVMLVRIPPSASLLALGLEALPLWDPAEPHDWLGETVTLAGLGDRTDGGDGLRQFLDETVVAASADAIVVDGGPEHGACAGDSGGPLLARSATGIRIIGILSEGSATCRGHDSYVPSTAFSAWVWQIREAAEHDPCSGLGVEGTCEGGRARWCAGEHVESELCSGDRLCGWDAEVGGYRCVPSDQDPCRGAGPTGVCDGNTLRVCQRGALAETQCGGCGLTCTRGPGGRAGCR